MTTRLHPWKNQRIGVIGAGRSGIAAARLLAKGGAQVLLSDSQNVSIKPPLPHSVIFEIGRHSDRLLTSTLLIRSPGIPDHVSILKYARRKNIPIWSELELASRMIHPKRLVAITGTNGKTTTTTLVGQLFQAVNPSTFVAGNIGIPLSAIVSRVTASSAVILETSSYQLENVEQFHPNISAILNITPDHLEHHKTLKAYVAAKANIFKNQSSRDICVLNADDPWCRQLAKRCPARTLLFSRRKPLIQGVTYEMGDVVIRWNRQIQRFPLRWDLPGPHNIENALAAIAIAVAGGIPVATIRRVLKRFRGVEHRLEYVRRLRGTHYVNDSKATNVDSTRVALESFHEPLILIMGGRGKGTPYLSLRALVKQHVRHLLLIGEDASRIKKELGSIIPYTQMGTMQKAVNRAAHLAKPDDIVLLSPACASFDQYANYEERGRHFKRLVRHLR